MTTTFPNANFTEMLGITPISLVPDQKIWNELLTPQVKAFLGEIQGEPTVRVQETVSGEFPGDEVTNLNGHLLYGKPGYVRFPYIQTVYHTKYGCLIIKRDGLKFKVTAWFGKRGKQELIFRASLRDRRFDGTKRADDTALLDFTYADTINGPLLKDGKPIDAKSVELSLYAFMPGSKIASACGDASFEEFVRNPYTFLDRPKLFVKHFRKTWKTERSPGQVANPIPDVSGIVPAVFDKFAIDAGYDFVENSSSHYHIAMWGTLNGYRYTNPETAKVLAAFTAGIKQLKANSIELTRPQESWVCVLQSLPKKHLPKDLKVYDLKGPVWPQDNIGPAILWMNKPLSERAKQLLPE